jgi:hypothetical protein
LRSGNTLHFVVTKLMQLRIPNAMFPLRHFA